MQENLAHEDCARPARRPVPWGAIVLGLASACAAGDPPIAAVSQGGRALVSSAPADYDATTATASVPTSSDPRTWIATLTNPSACPAAGGSAPPKSFVLIGAGANGSDLFGTYEKGPGSTVQLSVKVETEVSGAVFHCGTDASAVLATELAETEGREGAPEVLALLPKKKYMLATAGFSLRPRRHTHVNLNGSTIFAPNWAGTRNAIFAVEDVKDVQIYGGTLLGTRSLVGPHARYQESVGVRIASATNVELRDLVTTEFWWDGVIVMGASEDVRLLRVTSHHNRRSNLSLIGGAAITITDCVFAHPGPKKTFTVDPASDTFHSPSHGLLNGQRYALTGDALPTFGPMLEDGLSTTLEEYPPENELTVENQDDPTAKVDNDPGFFVMNATKDKFQLKRTAGSLTAIDVTGEGSGVQRLGGQNPRANVNIETSVYKMVPGRAETILIERSTIIGGDKGIVVHQGGRKNEPKSRGLRPAGVKIIGNEVLCTEQIGILVRESDRVVIERNKADRTRSADIRKKPLACGELDRRVVRGSNATAITADESTNVQIVDNESRGWARGIYATSSLDPLEIRDNKIFGTYPATSFFLENERRKIMALTTDPGDVMAYLSGEDSDGISVAQKPVLHDAKARIVRNQVQDFRGDGIVLSSTEGFRVRENTVRNNGWNGISVRQGRWGEVTMDNVVTGNGREQPGRYDDRQLAWQNLIGHADDLGPVSSPWKYTGLLVGGEHPTKDTITETGEASAHKIEQNLAWLGPGRTTVITGRVKADNRFVYLTTDSAHVVVFDPRTRVVGERRNGDVVLTPEAKGWMHFRATFPAVSANNFAVYMLRRNDSSEPGYVGTPGETMQLKDLFASQPL